MKLYDLGASVLLIGLVVAAIIVGLEIWDAHTGQSEENDGPVREMIEDFVEDRLGIDLDVR